MINLIDKPLIQYGVEEALNADIEKVKVPVISIMQVPISIENRINDKLGYMVENPKANPPSNHAITGKYILTHDIIAEL